MNNDLFLIIASIGSLTLIFVGCKMLYNIKHIKIRGIEVAGTISGIKKVIGANANTIYPEVTYKTKQNITITKNSNMGVLPGYYKLGQKITIVYDENKPESFIIKNYITYIVPLIMILIAVILILYLIFSTSQKI